MYEDLKVLKRDNKKADFNGEKIAIAIKKSFDSREEFIDKYTDEDINKVYKAVLDDIFDNYFEKPYIKVEDIQDVIEKILIKLDYKDVYESFSNYRDKRAESRKMFLSEPKQHKLLKAIEKITLKQDWVKKTNTTPNDVIFNYGNIISEEFANAYLLNSKYTQMQESGQVYIDNIESISIGTTESCIIDINKILEKGFSIENIHYKEPNDMLSYLDLMSLIIKRNSEDQHGDQGIQSLDFMMKQIVINTFKEIFNDKLYEHLDVNGYLNFVDFDSISKDISKLNSINIDISLFYKYSKEVPQIKNILEKSYNKSLESTDKIVYKALYKFLHNSYYKVNDKCRIVTISLGIDTSYEGRMITRNYLLSLDDKVVTKTVFKIKKGINYNVTDINYDLFKLAISIIFKGNNIGFSFMDFKPNFKEYNGSLESEVFYFNNGLRVMENILNEKVNVLGRGLLSKTYINLARIGLKNTNQEENKEELFSEIDNTLNTVIEQLYDRYLIQAERKASEFQFLMGENVYFESKGLKQGEKVKKSIRNGLLGIGIIGLNECIKVLKFKITSDEIIDYIYKKIHKYKNEYNLNYVLIGPDKDLSKEFIDIDRAIYGDIKDVTDKEYYDLYFNNIFEDKNITKFNGGYLIEKENTFKSEEELIKFIKDQDIGYISIIKKIED